ncbi:hypothetical protein OSTOST_23355 [Ostertagia ostertagi]
MFNNTQYVNEEGNAIKCFLVIPASNADPERSFSTANRLSRGERSNLKTETLDDLMVIHRNGPSVLTVKPRNLVHQWTNPRPGLKLKPHLPSSTERQGSLMKEIKDSLWRDDKHKLVDLYATHSMSVQGSSESEAADAQHQSKKDQEMSRAMIFSSGIFHDPDEDKQ